MVRTRLSQGSAELIIILSVVFVVLIFIMSFSTKTMSSQQSKEEVDRNVGILDTMESLGELVFAQGVYSQSKTLIRFAEGVQELKAEMRTITITTESGQVFHRDMSFDVVGYNLVNTRGRKMLYARSIPRCVVYSFEPIPNTLNESVCIPSGMEMPGDFQLPPGNTSEEPPGNTTEPPLVIPCGDWLFPIMPCEMGNSCSPGYKCRPRYFGETTYQEGCSCQPFDCEEFFMLSGNCSGYCNDYSYCAEEVDVNLNLVGCKCKPVIPLALDCTINIFSSDEGFEKCKYALIGCNPGLRFCERAPGQNACTCVKTPDCDSVWDRWRNCSTTCLANGWPCEEVPDPIHPLTTINCTCPNTTEQWIP